MLTNFTLPVLQDAKLDLRSGAKIKTYRREQAKFFSDFPAWWEKANIGVVTAMAQTESNGWITLTMCYYENAKPEPTPIPEESAKPGRAFRAA